MKGTETIIPHLDTKWQPGSAFETAAVSFWVLNFLVWMLGVPLLALTLAAFFPYVVLPLIVSYAVWAFVVEGDIHNRGGWGRKYCGPGLWFSNSTIWACFRNYFQAHLVKTADLPSNKNYIFSMHPHGVYLLGIFANITGNRRVFAEHFPGLCIRLATLPINFRLPGWREFFLSTGGISCDRKSLHRVLSEKSEIDASKPAGNCVALVVGGAEEFTYMEPGTMDLVLTKRKGFVKLALTTGASLVPILTFGENDTWKRSDASWVKSVNAYTQRVWHFAIPAIEGRYGCFFIPFPSKLVTVVGRAIDVEKVEHPTDDQIDALHKKYIQELFTLYETYKDDFFKDRKRDMQCIQ